MQDINPKTKFGIDINEYTQNPDFSILKNNIDFLYLRTSGSGSGSFRVDKNFYNFAKLARENNIPVGGYHYANPSYNILTADEQCNKFIETLQIGFGKRDYGDLFPVIDIEEPTGELMNVDVLLKWINRFRTRFEKLTRRRLMIYTSDAFVKKYNDFKLSNGSYPLSNMPLWIAMYPSIKGNPSYPSTVGNWTKWRVWQWSDSQKVNGTFNPVDANYGPNNIELLKVPSNVSNFKGIIENKNVVLTWSKVKDIDLLGYNIFIDGYWILTVDKNDVKCTIPLNKINRYAGKFIIVTIEAFDYDGDVSMVRSRVVLKI